MSTSSSRTLKRDTRSLSRACAVPVSGAVRGSRSGVNGAVRGSRSTVLDGTWKGFVRKLFRAVVPWEFFVEFGRHCNIHIRLNPATEVPFLCITRFPWFRPCGLHSPSIRFAHSRGTLRATPIGRRGGGKILQLHLLFFSEQRTSHFYQRNVIINLSFHFTFIIFNKPIMEHQHDILPILCYTANMDLKRKLPIGIQDFEKLRENGFV